jgi:hypothetical protein
MFARKNMLQKCVANATYCEKRNQCYPGKLRNSAFHFIKKHLLIKCYLE